MHYDTRLLTQGDRPNARLSYSTETVLSNKITGNRIVLLFKDSPRKPLGRRPSLYRPLKQNSRFARQAASKEGRRRIQMGKCVVLQKYETALEPSLCNKV